MNPEDIEEEIVDWEGDCGACSDPYCGCSCACGKCPIKDYSFYDEPDVDELQENQDFAQDDVDYGDESDY